MKNLDHSYHAAAMRQANDGRALGGAAVAYSFNAAAAADDGEPAAESFGAAAARDIAAGNTAIGIEFGSTRIKASLVGGGCAPIASGAYDWENHLADGIWTYPLEKVWLGLQYSFQELSADARRRYGADLATTGAIGISAMMHGYLAFDRDGRLLVPFRTWRNTITERAAALLTEAFQFNVPQRWSVAHLYQAILNGEGHVSEISYMTTLAGYVHWKLTGEKVIGVGDASGMFPIDSASKGFDARMLGKFNEIAATGAAGEATGAAAGGAAGSGLNQKLEDILPKVLCAGDAAGRLTREGAALIDPSGRLKAGIPLCPPEGDAGTGMVATNSVSERTGNVSAGTSIFAMFVLEKPLTKVYPEIDMVTTPAGKPVAMAHCNNCTTDLDAWLRLFGEVAGLFGADVAKPALYDAFYFAALKGEPDCGGLLPFNYYSGEHVTGFEQGRPLLARMPDSRFTVANLARALLFSAMATLKLGMGILAEKEHVAIERLYGHGGLFKTKGVGQRLMAGALNVPVAVMESAGEGGPWGAALLASYMLRRGSGEPLEAFLADKAFAGAAREAACSLPDDADRQGFAAFMARYVEGLAIERAAVTHMK